MTTFANDDFAEHEQIVFVADAETGLRGIIALHNTTLGPALGDCAPDFVINAGGMIRVASERDGFDQERVDAAVEGIGGTLAAIFARADAEGITTHTAAMRLAEERLSRARSLLAARPGPRDG